MDDELGLACLDLQDLSQNMVDGVTAHISRGSGTISPEWRS